MDASVLTKRLGELLAAPAAQRDADWASKCCTASQELHGAVWIECPPPQWVDEQVVPLLRQLSEAVAQARPEGRHREKISAFAHNVAARADNLQNYADGNPSCFLPQELVAMVASSELSPEQAVLRFRRGEDGDDRQE